MPTSSHESRPKALGGPAPRGPARSPAAAAAKLALRALSAPDRSAATSRALWDDLVAVADPANGGRPAEARAFTADLGVHLEHLIGVPGLTAAGWVSRVRDALARLENRIRVDRIIAEHPAIGREVVEAPVFVVGMPRTATTVTHRMLAGSAAHRGPLLWEYCHTGLDLTDAERDAVVAEVARQLDPMLGRAPGLDGKHLVRADEPDECDWLLPNTRTALCFAPVEAYREWIEHRDVTEDYRYLERALRILQYRRPTRRWVLKSPWHLAHLDVIAATFPDARFVWTHRDPVEAVGSFCSLAASLAVAHREGVRPEQTGGFWLSVLAGVLASGRTQRAQLPDSMFFDVPYERLVGDPEACFRDLYNAIGSDWTDADAARIRDSFARRRTRPPHRYRLDRYGIGSDDVERVLGPYSAAAALDPSTR